MPSPDSRRDYERLQDILLTMAHTQPELTLKDAVPVIQQVEEQLRLEQDADLIKSLDELAEFAKASPTVAAFMPEKRINAIKELRSLMHSRTPAEYEEFGGLKACKEAVDRAWPISGGITYTSYSSRVHGTR